MSRISLVVIGEEARATSVANGYTSATPFEKIALIHSEVSECLEALRKRDQTYFEVDGKPEGPIAELADVIIRVCELAIMLPDGGLLDDMVLAKMAYNKIRTDVPTKSGEKII